MTSSLYKKLNKNIIFNISKYWNWANKQLVHVVGKILDMTYLKFKIYLPFSYKKKEECSHKNINYSECYY